MAKQAISDKWVVVLAHPEWPHKAHTDASTVGVGTVLLQHHSQATLHWPHAQWVGEKSTFWYEQKSGKKGERHAWIQEGIERGTRKGTKRKRHVSVWASMIETIVLMSQWQHVNTSAKIRGKSGFERNEGAFSSHAHILLLYCIESSKWGVYLEHITKCSFSCFLNGINWIKQSEKMSVFQCFFFLDSQSRQSSVNVVLAFNASLKEVAPALRMLLSKRWNTSEAFQFIRCASFVLKMFVS